MAYADGNPRSKKQLKEWVAEGRKVHVFSPGPFGCKADGVEFLEGPHYPKPHSWYAKVLVEGGFVTKVVS